MSEMFDTNGVEMSSDEKTTWIQLVLSVVTYCGYVVVVLSRAAGRELTQTPYADALLWAIGISIVASVVIQVIVSIVSPRDAGKSDQRDKQIYLRGQYGGYWALVAGAILALVLALIDAPSFWIANTIYLAFVLSMVASSVLRIVAYRRGF